MSYIVMELSNKKIWLSSDNILKAREIISKKDWKRNNSSAKRYFFSVFKLMSLFMKSYGNGYPLIERFGEWRTAALSAGLYAIDVYPIENDLAMLLDVDEKTSRKRSWNFLLALPDLGNNVKSFKRSIAKIIV